MATKTKKRSKASYKKAGKKAAATKKRNIATKKRKRKSPSKSRSVATTKKRKSKSFRKIARRANPFSSKGVKSMFSPEKLTGALLLIGGLGAGGALKVATTRFVPAAAQVWYYKLFGVLAIAAGGVVTAKSRNKHIKAVGNGVIAYGVLDLLVSNVPALQAYLPSVMAPSALSGGYSMMGANVSTGAIEVVGANVNAYGPVEVVGENSDLTDLLEASC